MRILAQRYVPQLCYGTHDVAGSRHQLQECQTELRFVSWLLLHENWHGDDLREGFAPAPIALLQLMDSDHIVLGQGASSRVQKSEPEGLGSY